MARPCRRPSGENPKCGRGRKHDRVVSAHRVSVVKMLYALGMDVFALTRKLMDIESTTGMEAAVGEALATELMHLGYKIVSPPTAQ